MKPRIINLMIVISLLLSLLSITSLSATAVPYSVHGSVYDTGGDPIPQVNLTFTSNSTPYPVTNLTNPDGSFNGFGFGVFDYTAGAFTEPDPLAYIYADGEGDIITVKAEKEGYRTASTSFEVEGSRMWFNMTLEREEAIDPGFFGTAQGKLLIAGLAFGGLMAASIFIFFHFERKDRGKKEVARKRTKRRRR